MVRKDPVGAVEGGNGPEACVVDSLPPHRLALAHCLPYRVRVAMGEQPRVAEVDPCEVDGRHVG